VSNEQEDIVILEPDAYMLEVLRVSMHGSGIFPVYRVMEVPHEGTLAS